jgi:hypothetical protein
VLAADHAIRPLHLLAVNRGGARFSLARIREPKP